MALGVPILKHFRVFRKVEKCLYDTTKIVCIFLEPSCTTNRLYHFKGEWVYFYLFLFCHCLKKSLLLMERICFHTGENSFLQEQTPF